MPLGILSLINPLYFFILNVTHLNLKHTLALSELPDDMAVNCGSSGSSKGIDGRQWIGDIRSKYLVTSQGSKVKSTKSTANDPYTTVRISRKHFGYVFHVSPGQKFIRMYFYPTSYPDFKRFDGFFTVKAGPYTLLSNFSASLNANALGVGYFVKEFCVNVEDNQPLFITFSPSNEAYAFVNGIEIISMPLGLYYTPLGEAGTRVLGKKNQFAVDNSIALEMVHRLNVGGGSISSKDDTGLSREWSDDSNFFARSQFHPLITTLRIKYKNIPTYTAPQKVYQTSWDIIPTEQADKADNFTWKLPVDLGFRYLIRLHFCKLEYEIEESSRLRFSILINNQLAEANADIIKWSGGSGVAVFRDYVAIMEGDRMEGKQELLISLCPELSNNDDWWTENTDTILKGLEVFKLSNTDNNLAGVNPNPTPITKFSKNSKSNSWKFAYAHGGNSIATIITVLISFASIIVYQLRILVENYGDSNIPSSSSEGISRRFSLAEVLSATNNFDDLLVIGSGGFGLVYKGVIDGGTINVAIKRLNSNSKQGAQEFWTEIDMLSKLRHMHLVSLIGYCNEGREMILVYEYMEHGTLADHLYKKSSNGGSNFYLSWEQKLNICIGAARGLDYLHTGTRHGVIHRDVKTTNILLDTEWVAKVSDFGLCKTGTTNQSYTHVSTDVKGTFGYLDPEYFLTRRLTKKSDVYAFGVVLLEVLCGRPAVDISLTEDCRSLALWAQHCIKEGKLDELIDPNLYDQISSSCLKVLSEVAYKCLHKRPIGRPTMSDIVVSLEGALLSQNHSDELSSEQNPEEEVDDNESENDHMSDSESEKNESRLPHITHVRTKKRSKGKLSKAFEWSLGFFTKREEKDNDSSSRQSLDSDSLKLGEGSSGTVYRGLIDLSEDYVHLRTRHFTVAQILAATNNFNAKLKLGESGFGTMNRRSIDHGTLEVAIKCTKLLIGDELLTSTSVIEAHSQLHHPNILSIIGHCTDRGQMMLVYKYMVNRSLHDHLYGEGIVYSPLQWTKRLEIVIGAAKGLQYLHYGIANRIIHRNIKLSNILLDENWVAKISSFELSTVTDTAVTTSGGALEYIHHLRLSEKSDVYAFGVVLLEVVSGRKPYESSLEKELKPLVHWFRTCYLQNKVDQIVDPYLRGRISPKCLIQYLEIVWVCVFDHENDRPTMNSVVESLEIALQLQESRIMCRQSLGSNTTNYRLDSDNVHLRNHHVTAAEILAATNNFNDNLKLGEKIFDLSDQIFEDLDSISSTCFTEASKGSILQLLNFAEAIAIGPHTPEKLLRILDMYEVLASLILDIEALYTDEVGSQVTNECLDVLKRLGNCAKSTFLDFKNLVASNVSNTPFAGGGIHHITRYVMNYIKNLNDYIETLNELIKDYDKEGDFSFSPDLNPTSGEQNLSQSSSHAISLTVTSIHFKFLISILEHNLEDKSKLYKDDSIGHIFMMNNTHYITEKVKSSELRILLGDEWIRKHNWKFQQHARSYERSTWSSILSLLKEDGLYNRGSSSISKTLLKERLHNFYLVFEEVCKNQTSWLIPDTQLRDELRISISLKVIPAYRSFVGRHVNNLSKEIPNKYSADELEDHLLDLFEVSPKSLHSSRRK